MGSKLLDAKTVERAKATAKETILRDGSGLELRVYQSGGKVWQLRYQTEGKRRIYRMGEYPGVSLAEARRKAGELRKLLDAGVDPKVHEEEQAKAKLEAERIAKMEQAARKTFADVFDAWNTVKLSKRKDGVDLLRAIRKDILPFIGDKEIGAVTRGDIMPCLDVVAARAPRMANQLLTTLKTFYKWALLRDMVEANPLAVVEQKDVGGNLPSRDRVLSNAEIVDLFRKLPESGLSPTVQAAVLICLSTGCRLGEICAAQWAHVDGGVWTIPAENAKNGKKHEITLSKFAADQFRVLAEARESRWCLPSPKRLGSPQTRLSISGALLDRQAGGAARRGRTKNTSALVLGGGHWTAHDLRRTCASGMQELGVMPAVIDAALNHKEKKGVTGIYQRYDYAKEMAEAWAKWGRHLATLRARAKGIALVAGD
ncbi:MAG: integrase arm-type DNA-binding domain-containing protein [Candidatus Igneacidithiobacillus chanchocoensis]